MHARMSFVCISFAREQTFMKTCLCVHGQRGSVSVHLNNKLGLLTHQCRRRPTTQWTVYTAVTGPPVRAKDTEE